MTWTNAAKTPGKWTVFESSQQEHAGTATYADAVTTEQSDVYVFEGLPVKTSATTASVALLDTLEEKDPQDLNLDDDSITENSRISCPFHANPDILDGAPDFDTKPTSTAETDNQKTCELPDETSSLSALNVSIVLKYYSSQVSLVKEPADSTSLLPRAS